MKTDLQNVAPTITDKVVEFFSPAAGLERRKARMFLALAGGYTSGRRDRRPTRSWRPKPADADTDILPDLDSLRSRSRDLTRNTPIATGAINTVVTSVVGEGLKLKPEIDRRVLGLTDEQAEEFEQAALAEWRLFVKSADFTSVDDFDELQALAFRATLDSGDVLLVRRFREDFGDTYGLKLQMVEADRLGNPLGKRDGQKLENGNRIYAGVEVNNHGRHMAYHVADVHPGKMGAAARRKSRRVPARTKDGMPIVLHLFDRQRPDQTRGVPYLSPVIEALKQAADYSEAEITAAVVGAMFTVFVKSEDRKSVV